MNVIAEISRINERELALNVPFEASWHQKYSASAWIYIGGLPYELTEGDVLCVMSQFGEIEDLNLVRDGKTGKSKGFGFLKYENQRSTVLAVDNMNGAKLLERIVRVDHVLKYKLPKEIQDKEDALAQQAEQEEEDEEDEDDNDDKANNKKYKPRGLPGHAYEGKELASEYDLSRGHNVFAAPKETKDERKKRKKHEKKQRKQAKKLHKIEEKQTKLFEEIRKRRRAQQAAQAQAEAAAAAAAPPPPPLEQGAMNPSATGWRGRLEPSGPPAPRSSAALAKGPLASVPAGPPLDPKEAEAEFKARDARRKAGFGGINRVR